MKIHLVGAILSVLGTAWMGSAHAAVSIVPTTEGEIQLSNLACLGGSVTCLNTTTSSVPYSVTTLAYDTSTTPQYGLSRLFSDKRGTANNWGFGINFGATDAGTNAPAGEYIFRPVAYNANGSVIENGQLEAGRFKFDFGKLISNVELSFFDTETPGTGILEINGTPISQLLNPGGNDNLQKISLSNVSSFVVQLGNSGKNDGVDLGVKVPEPSNILGFASMVIVGGALATKNARRRKAVI